MLGFLKTLFGDSNEPNASSKFATSPPPLPAKRHISPEALCDEAWEIYTAGDASTAKQMLSDGLTTLGEDSDIRFTLAKILAREYKADFALGANAQTPEQASEIVSQWRSGQYLLLHHAERAHQLTPDDSTYRFVYSQNWAALGNALEKAGHFDDAFEAYATSQDIESPTSENQAAIDKHVLVLMHKLLMQAKAANGPVDTERAALYRTRAEHARIQDKVYAFQCDQLADILDPNHSRPSE